MKIGLRKVFFWFKWIFFCMDSGFKNLWINELKDRSKDHFADSKIEPINLSFLESVRLKFFEIFFNFR